MPTPQESVEQHIPFPDTLRERQDSDKKVSQEEDPLALVQLIKDNIRDSESEKQKHGYMQEKEKFDRLYRNKLYQNNSQKRLYFESRANYYRKYVDRMATILTRDPVFDAVLRRDQAHADLKAEILERTIDYINYKNDRNEKDFQLAVQAAKYGNSFMYMYWDPFDDDFQGIPKLEVINPKYCGLSTGASSIEDAVYFYYKRPVSTHQLKQMYPDLNIIPDTDVSSSIPNNVKEGGKFVFSDNDPNNGAFLTWSANGNKLNIGKGPKRQTWLTDYYYRDPAKMDLTTIDDLTQWMDDNPGFGSEIKRKSIFNRLLKKLPMSVLKYPHGRRIQIANDQILEDHPNPYPWIPFVNFTMYTNDNDFWGQGVMNLIREMVKNIHLASSGLAANIDYVNRPFWVTDSNKYDDSTSFVKNPNDLVVLEPGRKLEAAQIPGVASKNVLDFIEFRIQECEDITGLYKALFGKMPAGTAPSAIQMQEIQDAAIGVILPISRRYLRVRQEIGNRFIWFIQNFMTDKREILFTNPDDQQQTTGQTSMGINQPSMNNQIINDVTEGDWEYYINETYGRPFGYAARFKQIETAAAAMQKFAPDQAAQLQLEASQMPGWRKYAKTVQDRFMMQLEISITNAQREREMKELVEVNKITADNRKAEAAEVKSGAYAEGLRGKAILETAQALQTGMEAEAQMVVDATPAPLGPTPPITPAPTPATIPGIGQLPGSFQMPQQPPSIQPGGQG